MFLNLLLLFVPISLVLAHFFHGAPLWVFITSLVAIVPLAEWMRRATDHLARRAGPAIGGLLNVTFGNAAELILALIMLEANRQNVVKAQITGSIIGNGLLGLGLAVLVGCWGKEKLTFKTERAGLLSSLLILSLLGLLIPAVFSHTEHVVLKAPHPGLQVERLSLCVSCVLIFLYFANLAYTLVTHRDVFALQEDDTDEDAWPVWRSLAILAGATAAITLESELLSGALEETAGRLHLTSFFLGVVVLAIVGNAAEYLAAIYFARRGQMGLVMTITVGSTIQVALLVAPILVIVSKLRGHPMDLVFGNPLELLAVAGTAFAVNAIAHDGEVTWFEGLLLLGVYVMLALAFFFVNPP